MAEAVAGAGYRELEVVEQWQIPVGGATGDGRVAERPNGVKNCSANTGGGAVSARIRFAVNSMRGHQETRMVTIRWIFVARERLITRGYRASASGTSRKAES
ncbi:hypothetical protein [Amycolatopsis sp. cg9]|uniref:hypothetical protein n=1 Tax=Amycolatopsis sp. cg9 TaxID=3238801 RepID=UPI003525EA17